MVGSEKATPAQTNTAESFFKVTKFIACYFASLNFKPIVDLFEISFFCLAKYSLPFVPFPT